MEKNNDVVIKVENVSKNFKVYLDKGYSLKEKMLFWKRNRYENRRVLNNISFEVKKGDSIGLIGRNGCGKSTMLKMLTKIYYPNSGKITVNGRVSSLIELGAGFHPDMSGRENIYINASIFGLTREQIDARLNDIIEFSELKDFIDNPVRTYSSGMYMRLAFSVAINVDADILLIDEILAVGDANFQSKCFNKMKELKASGITIVLVTHSMQSIKDFCDKCIWIEKGKVMGIGSTNDVTEQYIQYMLDEKIMQSLDEQDRAMINLEAQRKEIEKKREKGLDSTQDHFGTKYAILKEVYVTDENNRKTQTLRTNHPFNIIMRYKIIRPTKTIEFGMGFNAVDKQRTVIYGTNTTVDKINFKLTKKEGTVIFHSKTLPLQKGVYYLNVAITGDNLPLDYYNAFCKITVVSDKDSAGLFVFPHSWEINGKKV